MNLRSRGNRRNNPALVSKFQKAEFFRKAGDLFSACRICKEILDANPKNVDALVLLGLLLLDLERYRDAERYLGRAISLYPRDWRVLTAASTVQSRLHNYDEALRLIRKAKKLEPRDVNVGVGLAEFYMEWRNYELALKVLRGVVSRSPNFQRAKMLLADCYEMMGDVEAAADLLREILDAGEISFPLLQRLANLPPPIIPDGLIERMRQAGNFMRIEPSRLLFTRALVLHQAGRHVDAWADLKAANDIQREVHTEAWHLTQPERAGALEYARASSASGSSAYRPCGDRPVSLFILGPSRSGKTTLERLVGQLPGVVRGYEGSVVQDAARKVADQSGRLSRAGEFLCRIPPGAADAFVDAYFATLKDKIAGSRVLTNTNPFNIASVFDIAKYIRNAFFVFVHRNEEDVMLRIYMKSYRRGGAYSYDLRWIREYLDWHHNMERKFIAAYPNISRVVNYENLVQSPEHSIDVVAKLCGIDSRLKELPEVGDDRGVAGPYKAFMFETLAV